MHKAGQPGKSTLADEELLSLYRTTGNAEYFGELYHRYIPLVYGLCLKYLQHAENAQDAVMQLYEDLAAKLDRYDIKVFRTWLYSVAKNHCLQMLRKEKHEIRVDFDVQIMESDMFFHLFDERRDEEQFEALRKCMEQLPEPQRISISKFFMDEMSYADIVDDTGYRLKSVKSYIQNGKRNLKICIEKQISQ
ncbi:MAG: sigma-70 family RNA polymerase sigma factor [Bacteroidales bacterium]|nr:sigma-70 family RNA polymerase sigma factor [Bacteroidales bacterium]